MGSESDILSCKSLSLPVAAVDLPIRFEVEDGLVCKQDMVLIGNPLNELLGHHWLAALQEALCEVLWSALGGVLESAASLELVEVFRTHRAVTARANRYEVIKLCEATVNLRYDVTTVKGVLINLFVFATWAFRFSYLRSELFSPDHLS